MRTTRWDTWQDVSDSDLEAVGRQLGRGELTVARGGVLERFERRFAAFAGSAHAVATNNGTGALHAALWAVGVRSGHEVAVCDYGFHAMAAAIRSLGAIAVPVDAEPHGMTMDPGDLRRALSARTRAVLVHNPWGIPADYRALRAAAGELPLIADASHAHGARYQGEGLAAAADIACFSLGQNKLISGGELGCAVTGDAELRDRMVAYGHVNRGPGALRALAWQGNAVGLKLRPHPAALVLALGQLRRFPEKRERLVTSGQRIEALAGGFGLQALGPGAGGERVYWRHVFKIPGSAGNAEAQRVLSALQRAGVPAEPNHYWPSLQNQSLFAWPDHRDGLRHRACPVVDRLTPTLLTLPAWVAPTEDAYECLHRGLAAAFG